MNIEELTIGQVRELAAMITAPNNKSASDHPWEVGKNYLIRTVTMIDIGKLISVTDQELVLEDAAWIADTGRFSDCLEKCEYGEVEPFPLGRVIIGRGSVVDAVVISKINRSKK